MGSHYDILGLTADATDQEITDQYRALSKIVHPDVGGDDVMFDVLSDSYAILSDPAHRVSYDAELNTIAEASASVGVPCGASRRAATIEDAFTPHGDPIPWRDRRSTPAQRQAARNQFTVHSSRGRSHLTRANSPVGTQCTSRSACSLRFPSPSSSWRSGCSRDPWCCLPVGSATCCACRNCS